jgi:hypothetical protein
MDISHGIAVVVVVMASDQEQNVNNRKKIYIQLHSTAMLRSSVILCIFHTYLYILASKS